MKYSGIGHRNTLPKSASNSAQLDPFQNIRIRRIQMRANGHAHYYRSMKRVIALLLNGSDSQATLLIPVPENTPPVQRRYVSKSMHGGMHTYTTDPEKKGNSQVWVAIHPNILR